MSNNITIKTSTVRLTINDDENRVIEFNPEDLAFIEALYDLINDFDAKEKDFKKRDRVLNANKDTDKHGLPKNTKAKIALNRELCSYMRAKVDNVFGEGTADTAFGKANTIDMFAQFFEGITPFIENARSKKLEKYVPDSSDQGIMQ